MRFLLVVLCALGAGAAARADIYMGELSKPKCVAQKGKDFMRYVREALSDKKLDVVYDENGSCGKSVYVMKKANRRRWAVFPTNEGCTCYLNKAKALEEKKN